MMVEHNQSANNGVGYNNKYKFNGKELDDATGMYYYGARYYDPRISIFVSVDPLAEKFQGWTPYHYVHNNPVNMVDPTGMSKDGIENEYTRYIKNGVVQEVKQTGTDGGDIYDKITDVDLDRPIMEVGTTFIVPVERSESIVATNLRSKDGASAGTYREPGFKHDYKYKAQSQAIEPMGLDSPFFVIGGVASKVLRSKSASSGVTSTLQKHVTRAANEVDELGDAAFTVKQL